MKDLQKKLRLLSILLMAVVFLGSMTLSVEAYIQKPGNVNEAVTLRQNADSTSNQVMQLSNGQAVTVNNEVTGADGATWYQVIVNNNTLGYVPASTVTVSGGSVQDTGGTTQKVEMVSVTERIAKVTAGSSVRVRAEASTSSNQIASLQPNATFLVLEDVNAADGYVWLKGEIDDNGTVVVGYVRSDLVTVEEVTREVEQIVEVPAEEPQEKPEEQKAPYTITSQVNAEGTTVYYLVNNETGESKEVSALFVVQEEEKESNGVFKIIIVILLILVILAAGAATFFFMRWRDAEEFITELREKQARAKKQTMATRTPQSTAGQPIKNQPKPATPTGTTPVKEAAAVTAAQPTQKPLTESSIPTRPAAPAQNIAQPVKTATPAPAPQSATAPAPQPKPAAPQPTAQPTAAQPVKPAAPVPAPQPKPEQPAKSTVMPDTMDIVKATQQELKNNAANNAPKQQSAWKSKNFLTDDDDLEFDFLDSDDK